MKRRALYVQLWARERAAESFTNFKIFSGSYYDI
jgi:hypothetical protein